MQFFKHEGCSAKIPPAFCSVANIICCSTTLKSSHYLLAIVNLLRQQDRSEEAAYLEAKQLQYEAGEVVVSVLAHIIWPTSKIQRVLAYKEDTESWWYLEEYHCRFLKYSRITESWKAWGYSFFFFSLPSLVPLFASYLCPAARSWKLPHCKWREPSKEGLQPVCCFTGVTWQLGLNCNLTEFGEGAFSLFCLLFYCSQGAYQLLAAEAVREPAYG